MSAGYQWAGKYALQQTQAAYPEVPLMQTESECGDGANTWLYAQYIFELMWHYFTNGISAYIYWNMVLPPGGQSTWGWKQNSMMTIDPALKSVRLNPEYYLMKHFSHTVDAGAVRLGLSGIWAANALAFENPDQSISLIITNPFNDVRQLPLNLGKLSFTTKLAPASFNTFVISSR